MDYTIEDTIKQYLEGMHDEEIVMARIRNGLKDKNIQTVFLKEELEWLENHFDKIPSILNSKMACQIFLAINKMKGAYLRQLCRQLSHNSKKPLANSVVDWWLKKFFRIYLLRKHQLAKGWGCYIMYYTPKLQYPNLLAFLTNLMKERAN